MALPPFLLLDDSYTDVQELTGLIKRIGIANVVRPFGRLDDARAFLAGTDAGRLPIVMFVASRVRGGRGVDLLHWARSRPELAGVRSVALLDAGDESGQREAAELGVAIVSKPLEMPLLMAALKALGLAERVRINNMTMSVDVELWPPGRR